MACSVEGCVTETIARGFCMRHYQRWRRHGDPTFTKFDEHWSDRCRSCGRTTTRDDYYSGARVCKDCKSWERLKKYGLTKSEYLALVRKQDDGCAVCKTPLAMVAKPNIDHDHATGQVRGILCAPCNVGLGAFKDDLDLLLAAVEYLR